MSGAGSREQETDGPVLIVLPKELDRARVGAGLAIPDPIGPDEAYKIRSAFGLNRKYFGELIGTAERSIYNYESGLPIPTPVLILYNTLKARIRKETETRALGDESARPLAAYTIDELTAEINGRIRTLTASSPLPEPPPKVSPGRPRKPRGM